MVALRRPDELTPPSDDGLPTRPIRDYALDKIHYWGNFLEAASTATKRAFPARICADLFCSFGVGEDKQTHVRSWGTALVARQVAVPFDLYFFNDLDPEATQVIASRARE